MKQTLTAQEQDAGMRIDKFLHLHLPEYSRSFCKKNWSKKLQSTDTASEQITKSPKTIRLCCRFQNRNR